MLRILVFWDITLYSGNRSHNYQPMKVKVLCSFKTLGYVNIKSQSLLKKCSNQNFIKYFECHYDSHSPFIYYLNPPPPPHFFCTSFLIQSIHPVIGFSHSNLFSVFMFKLTKEFIFINI